MIRKKELLTKNREQFKNSELKLSLEKPVILLLERILNKKFKKKKFQEQTN